MPIRTAPQFIDTDTFELSPHLKVAKYLAQHFTGFTTGGVTEVERLVAGAVHNLVAGQNSRIRHCETPGFILPVSFQSGRRNLLYTRGSGYSN